MSSIDSSVEFSSPLQLQEGKGSFSHNSVVAITRELLGEKAGLKTDMALDLGKETVSVNPFIQSSSRLTPDTFSSSLSNIAESVNENSSFYPKLSERGATGLFEVGIGINSANVDIAFPKEFVKEDGKKIVLGSEQQKAFRKTITEYASLIKRGIYLEGLKEALEKTGGEVKDLQGTQANLDAGTVEVLLESANRASEIKAQRAYEIANGLPPRASETAQSMPITTRREFATPTVNQQEIKASEPEFRLSARKKILVGGSVVTLVTTTACVLVPSFHPTPTVTEIPTETKTASPAVSPTPEKTNTPTVTPTVTETSTPTEKPQETIDLPMSNGETFTVKKFETSQEGENYIVENTRWYNEGDNVSLWVNHILTDSEDSSYIINKVRKIGLEQYSNPLLTLPRSSNPQLRFYMNLDRLHGMSTVLFEKKDGGVELIVVDVDPSAFQNYVDSNPPAIPTLTPVH